MAELSPASIVEPPVIHVPVDLTEAGELRGQRWRGVVAQVIEHPCLAAAEILREPGIDAGDDQPAAAHLDAAAVDEVAGPLLHQQIGRASCRESVCQYV